MKIHVLSGFLGSGKTTAIQLGSLELRRQNIKPAIITNDQGMKMVDSIFLKKNQVPLRQVENGCFCCNFNKLEHSIESLVENNRPDEIFAESVGSCTDIIATVINPLLQRHPGTIVSFSTFADARLLYQMLCGNNHIFEASTSYIFFKQLEEAGVIVINKIDLFARDSIGALNRMVQERVPDKIYLFQNSLNEENIEIWLDILHKSALVQTLPTITVDYDIYAKGEANLAWLDQELLIYSANNNAQFEALELVKTIHQKILSEDLPIGHLKFILDNDLKISFATMDTSNSTADIKTENANSCELLINARVQIEPSKLALLIGHAIAQIEIKFGNKIIQKTVSAFQPGYPIPQFRIQQDRQATMP